MFDVSDAIAPVREQPFAGAALMTQALRGERGMIYDRNGEGWAWGQLEADGYVGWLPEAALAKHSNITHQISALRTFAFPGASIKLPLLVSLLLGSWFTVLWLFVVFVVL